VSVGMLVCGVPYFVLLGGGLFYFIFCSYRFIIFLFLWRFWCGWSGCVLCLVWLACFIWWDDWCLTLGGGCVMVCVLAIRLGVCVLTGFVVKPEEERLLFSVLFVEWARSMKERGALVQREGGYPVGAYDAVDERIQMLEVMLRRMDPLCDEGLGTVRDVYMERVVG
jgi:hypothetical protein